MSEAVHNVLARLKAVRRCGSGWIALCPAHDDHRPSLSIKEGHDGRVLLYCRSRGCATQAIVRAAGFEMRDLFDDDDFRRRSRSRGAGRGAWRPSRSRVTSRGGAVYPTARAAVVSLERRHGRRVAAWPYLDIAGEPVALVVRFDLPTPLGEKQRKVFWPVSRHADGWRIVDPPGRWPLFRLPDLADAPRVFIVEGEGCAERAWLIGLVATTSAHGAESAKGTDWTPLAGRDVVILPDNDAAGERYARDVARILARLTARATVRIVKLPGLPPGGDIVDFIEERERVRP